MTGHRKHLESQVARITGALSGREPEADAAPDKTGLSRLDGLTAMFGLGEADIVLLLLAAAAELQPDSLPGRRATVSLALQLAGEGAWAAACPQSPLRRWRMVEVEGTGPAADRTVRLDERILGHLLGLDYLDPRLDGLVERLAARTALSDGEAATARKLEPLWAGDAAGWPVLQLCGPGPEAKRAVAAALCAARGQTLFRMARADAPRSPQERHALARLCDREMALVEGVLLIEGDGSTEEEDRAPASFVDLLLGPVIVAGRDALALRRSRRLRADMPAPPPSERRDLWTRALNGRSALLGDRLDRLADQFALDEAGVAAVTEVVTEQEAADGDALFDTLWDGARAQARRRLDDLAERVEAKAGWDDLVLPADRLQQLSDVAVHVRRAAQVHGGWGWAEKGSRGLGVTVLFAGPSGAGKTMAAEVLARELRLDLYRIDLSQVVSKYIGETEKNLRRIFEAAEQSGAILLFDEADALFGKRSEVKDSHDRYANVEVSYLLQRMEAYCGLAVLTSNLKSALDTAFMRRLRFVIDFPFPDATMRGEIWRRIFPSETPVEGDPGRMARLAIAGGTIRTIAVNAAFLAAEAGGPVTTAHLVMAARREYAKLDKPITAAEFGGLG